MEDIVFCFVCFAFASVVGGWMRRAALWKDPGEGVLGVLAYGFVAELALVIFFVHHGGLRIGDGGPLAGGALIGFVGGTLGSIPLAAWRKKTIDALAGVVLFGLFGLDLFY